jgi:glycosyltransferase involved in cell wall biosynthesis
MHFASLGYRVEALHQQGVGNLPGVRAARYSLERGNYAGVHPFAQEFESKVLRGEACARQALVLKAKGLTPGVAFVHPGWGEALYLKEVFPDVRLVCLTEFYYRATGQDMGFDPEAPEPTFEDRARLHTKNANLLLAMEAMDVGIAATRWQASVLPAWAQAKTRVIHEGIDTVEVSPDASAMISLPDRGVHVRAGDEVLTFVSRNLEPVRGFHTFMRALPAIMAARPRLQVFIVGGDGVSYGALPSFGSYRKHYLAEVAGGLDPARVHFMGQVPRSVFVRLMQVSRCHIFLTYPFVLSWSMLEAMSAGALVVGSDTAPVREVIQDGVNGVLTDFFDAPMLAQKVIDVLASPQTYAAMAAAGRQTVVDRYDLNSVCLPKYRQLLEELVGA